MNVAALLIDQARRTPDRIALLDRSRSVPRSMTFSELSVASTVAAAHFTGAGLRPGDRVAVLHPMSLDLYIALAGLLRAGLVPAFCDPSAGRTAVERCFARLQPRGLYAGPMGRAYAATLPSLAHIERRFTPRGLRCRAPETYDHDALTGRADNDPALITFTSGSTAVPKIVVRSHRLLSDQLRAIREIAPPAETEISTMPIVLLANLASGTTSVIPGVNLRRPGSADPYQLARDIAWSGATSIVASPAMLERLASIDAPKCLVTLTRIATGGAPVTPRLMKRLHDMAPQAQILGIYGSTEAEPIATIDFSGITIDDVKAMRNGGGLLAGTPTPSSMVRIVDGEIIVSGDHVVPGYLDGEGDSETKPRFDGRIWHRTGDGGYFDSKGRLWLTGRISAAVRDERGSLSPFSVETALSFDPKIARSALMRDTNRRIVVVEANHGRRPSRRRLNHMLRWANIDEIRIVRRIPVDRRHNAKIDYPALRRLIGVEG